MLEKEKKNKAIWLKQIKCNISWEMSLSSLLLELLCRNEISSKILSKTDVSKSIINYFSWDWGRNATVGEFGSEIWYS